MFKTAINVAILLLAAGWISGCQSLPHAPSAATSRDSALSSPNKRAYFFFTAAQLELRRGDINEAIWLMGQAIKRDGGSDFLRLEMANLLLIKKETARALKLIETVLAGDPDNLQAQGMAGRIYHQQKRTDEALAAFEKVLVGKPKEPNAYLIVGRIYWNKNDFDNAERVFRMMIDELPHSYAAFYFYGKVLAAKGKAQEAEQALMRSLELEPSLEEPRNELLKIYKRQNRSDRIARTYLEMLQFNPVNHKAALGLAEHYHGIDQDPAAQEILERLAGRVHEDATVVSTLFDMYLETKQYENAIWAIEGMLRTLPDNSDLHYMAGVSADGLEDNQRALNHVLQVAPDSRFYTNAVVHGALLYHDMGKIDQAIVLVRKALDHKPDYSDFYLYLGSFYEKLERYEDAMQVLQKGVKRDAENPRLHFRIGVVYDKMGQRQDSIAAMRNVLLLAPNDAEALNYLGYTYADLGINLDEAETLIQAALKIKPDDGYIADSLGWVYYKRGQYTQALKWLNRAVQLQPEDPTILEHLGDIHMKLDSTDKALNYYRRSLDKKETNRETLQEKIRTLTAP